MTAPHFASDRVTIYNGDCLDVLKGIPDASIDAIVIDPPYGLSREPDMAEVLRHWLSGDDYRHRGTGFMGKTWDSFVPGPAVWRECLRVLKPGGHLLCFAGTRTFDLMGVSIRFAGFEIRDSLAWLYGSGFPKSLDVSKAIDKVQGARREVVGRAKGAASQETVSLGPYASSYDATTPATDDAKRWQGWGTALKPAQEPILVARKPLTGTVAANVLAHGTGAMNIDACRVRTTDKLGGGAETLTTPEQKGHEGWVSPWMSDPNAQRRHAAQVRDNVAKAEALGRWPANVVLSHSPDCVAVGTRRVRTSKGVRGRGGTVYAPGGFTASLREVGQEVGYADADGMETVEAFECAEGCPVAELDAQSGSTRSTARTGPPGGTTFGGGEMRAEVGTWYGDRGGASRFFPSFRYQAKAPSTERPEAYGVQHPTVKPLALMQWLVRLVTPPDGIVLDPFAGSGTTAEACIHEGFRSVMVESDEDYIPLIEQRVRRGARRAGASMDLLPIHVTPDPVAPADSGLSAAERFASFKAQR